MYVRSVVRSTNEENMFNRLMKELVQIGKDHSKNEDEINDLFFKVCCSKAKLIEYLKKENYTKWSELEDLAI